MKTLATIGICLAFLIGMLGATSDDIVPSELTITTEKLPYGTVGKDYAFKLEAKGGKELKWEITGLPDGLKQEQNAIIGTPEKEGGYEVIAYVTDGEQEAKKSFKLTITKDILPPPPIPEPNNVIQNFGAGMPSRKEVDYSKITIQHFLNMNSKDQELAKTEAYRIMREQISACQNIDGYTARLLHATKKILEAKVI